MLDGTDSDPSPSVGDVLSRSIREWRSGPGPVRTAVQKPPKLPRGQSYRQKPGNSASSQAAAEAKSGDCVITHFPRGGRRVALESLRQCSLNTTHRKEVREPKLDAPAPSVHDVDRTSIKSQSKTEVRILDHSDGREGRVGGLTRSHSTAVFRPTHGQATHLDAAAENTVTGQPQSSKATEAAAAVETAQVSMEKRFGCQSQQQIRDNQCLRGPQIESADSHSGQIKGMVSRVNQVLREVKQVQSQMESLVQPFQGAEIKKKPVGPSPLEDAAQVLHQIRRQTKIFDENLNLVLRAAQTEAFHHRLDATIRNSSDWTHPAQIRRTVDAWLSLQPEVSEETTTDGTAALADFSSKRQAPLHSVSSKTGKSVSTSRQTGRKMLTGNGVREQAAQKTGMHHQKVVPQRGRKGDRQLKAESYLTQRYGKSPKLPYTPSATRVIRKNHPRLVENIQESPMVNSSGRLRLLAELAPVTGPSPASMVAVENRSYEHQRDGDEAMPSPVTLHTVKVTDTKNEESPHLSCSPPSLPLSRKSRLGLVESVRGIQKKFHKAQTKLAPSPTVVRSTSSAPAFTSSSVQPHQCSSTHSPSGDSIDCHLPIYVAVPLGPPMVSSSGRWCPPTDMVPPIGPSATSIVATDNGAAEHQDTCEAPHPPVTSRTVKIVETKSEEDMKDGENIFPGSDFLSVADIVQEEDSVVGENTMEVFGRPATPPMQYQGPVFPPEAPTALRTQNHSPILGSSLDSNALINRLAEWVEQQVISQLILELIPTSPRDPTDVYHSDPSEVKEQSDTSDIEAAGDSDMQRFLDANPSVDRKYFEQILTEALLKIRASILAEREEPTSSPGSEPGLDQEKPRAQEQFQDEVLFTPPPSPPPSLAPPTSTENMTVVATPPLSESPSSLIESPAQSITPAYVATPSPSPEPIHSGGSPTTSNSPEVLLPLDKETPEEDPDKHKQALLTSVAEEQPPLSSPLSQPPPPPEPELVPPSTSSEESSTSMEESSSSSSYSSPSAAVTAGTEAGLKHISEGELVINVNQQAVMTEEEMAACCFSNSLQDFPDMEFDPASEGEVKGRALILSQARENRGDRPQPEGSGEGQKEGSIGEMKGDGILKAGGPRSQLSPGQISQGADMSELSSERINQIQGISGDTSADLMGTLTSDLVTDWSLSPPPDPLPRLEGTD